MIEMLDKKELLAMLHKQCTRCGKVKYFGEFGKHEGCAGGVNSRCKSCVSESRRKWRKDNQEKIRENNRKWYEANNEKARESSRKWYEANKEKVRESSRKYREENSEKRREYNRKWKRNNPEKHREHNRKWQNDNPEKRRENHHRRRARVANAAGSFTAEQWQARLEYHGNRCIYCGCDGKMTIEHLIPLVRGGTNWPSNLAPSCRSCNCSKGTKTHFEFLEWIASRDRLSTTPTGEHE